MKLDLNMSLMEKNDAIAAAIRAELQQQGVYSINIIDSPGAGKTSLLERLLPHLPLQTAVIEGDLAGLHITRAHHRARARRLHPQPKERRDQGRKRRRNRA